MVPDGQVQKSNILFLIPKTKNMALNSCINDESHLEGKQQCQFSKYCCLHINTNPPKNEAWQLMEAFYNETQALLRQIFCQFPPNNLIGIPTTQGIEFLKTDEIVRCEGLQRLTKVFTEKSTIISSYNIGQFSKLLNTHGFFAPHKSHLINLQYLRSYYIDGTIVLRDGARVPLARRRKDFFLERLRHLQKADRLSNEPVVPEMQPISEWGFDVPNKEDYFWV